MALLPSPKTRRDPETQEEDGHEASGGASVALLPDQGAWSPLLFPNALSPLRCTVQTAKPGHRANAFAQSFFSSLPSLMPEPPGFSLTSLRSSRGANAQSLMTIRNIRGTCILLRIVSPPCSSTWGLRTLRMMSVTSLLCWLLGRSVRKNHCSAFWPSPFFGEMFWFGE